MSTPDQLTATLSQLRVREIMHRRPGQITVTVHDGRGRRACQLQQSHAVFGASAGNDVVLHGEGVSGVHFELEATADGISLRDLGSKNGTWLGRHARVFSACLRPGTRVVAGSCLVEVDGVDEVDVPVSTTGMLGGLHGPGTAMGALFAKLQRVASFPVDVLVYGETGTGKELVSKALHDESDSPEGPFIVVDCTTLNEGVVESVLFGHRKGAFTGAATDQAGLIEQADGGTLFLDEIGDLPLALQPKLLRVLQERAVRRVGETEYRHFDARVVAATHRDLLRMVGDGTFREDLYFRLRDVTLEVPPLRVRGKADIQALVELFVSEFSRRPMSLSRDAWVQLERHSWPGNVRELRSAIRYAALWAEGNSITATDLPRFDRDVAGARSRAAFAETALLSPFVEAKAVFERAYVTRALAEAEGNQSEAARRAEMSRSAFRDLLKRTS